MSKIHVFTDADLDGAGCFLMLKTAFPNDSITYSVTTEKKFRSSILGWLERDDFSNYDKVFVCDLNIKNDIALINQPNVVVFDHHAEHVEHLEEYTLAKPVIKDYSSCTLLLYRSLKLEDKLNEYQKLLVKIVDDYDSYTLSIPYSRKLNQIFWNYTGDRVNKFLKDFEVGFKGFNRFHKNTLIIVERKIQEYFKKEKIFKGNIKISGKECTVLGGFFSFSPNEIAERALDENNGDIIFLMNLNTKTCIMRKSKSCDIHMGKLAETLADGGGHEDAAGCLVNDTIINITKLLEPVCQ